MEAHIFSFNEARKALQDGTLTCEQLVEGYLTRIDQKQHLNALREVYTTEARELAKVVDQKIKSGTAGRLAGMVITIKDVLCHSDHELAAGSKILEGFTSQFTGTAIQKLIDEDAIIIGRNNCDEFAMGSSNENSAYGPVLNDIDNSRVPGGSSGGSAVAVQADMCMVSLGSDTGGSVRQPASFCGVTGLKPTYSRISRHGLIAYASSFDCIGIFSKHTSDIALVLEVVAGSDEYDSTVSKKPVPSYSELIKGTSNNAYKVAYIKETLASEGLDNEVKESVQNALESLKSAGHSIEEVDFPLMEYALPTYYILTTAEASSNLSRFDGVRYGHRSDQSHDLESMYKKSRAEGFGTEVKRRIMLGTFILSASYYDAYYNKAQKVRRILRDKTKALLEEYDFILTPTAPTTAFKLGENKQDPLQMYLADLYTVQASVCGLPAISVPCGDDKNGLPIGLQIMANDFEEGKLLQFSDYFLNLN